MLSSTPALKALCLASVLFASVAHADAERVLVIAGGTTPDHEALTHARQAIATGSSLAVVSDVESAEVLDSVRSLGVTCNVAEAPCAARVGALGGVDLVIVLVARGDERTLMLVDVVSSTERSAVARQVTPESKKAAIESAVVELVTPERFVGTLLVTGAPDGATLSVDGAPATPLSLAAPLTLKAGVHDLVVEHGGARLFEQTVDITYANETTVNVTPMSDKAQAVEGASTSVLPTALLIGGGVTMFASVIAMVIAGSIATGFFYVGCNALGAARGTPLNQLLCLSALPIYDDVSALTADDKEYVASTQLMFGASLAVALLTGIVAVAGGGAIGASFFVE